MKNKYLLISVGGSDEPIVSSIEQNKPGHIYFICSDDSGETNGSYHTVDGKDKPCGIVTVCPECNSKKGATRANIVTQAGLDKSQYTVIKISQLDDLNECYLKTCDIIKEIRQVDSTAEIIADYTCGTKSMSSGLAAAAMDDGNTNICIVKGRRVDLHKVKEGTQSARLIESNKIFIEKKLALIDNLWQNYNFQSCLEVISEIFSRPQSDNISPRLDTIRYLCTGFEAWDRFDHSSAIDCLKPYKDIIKAHLKLLGEINRVKEWWPDQKKNNPESKNKKQRLNIYSFAPVYDLILNARRREKQGRFDDAVARLYRALEMFGQINLLRWDHPLYTSDLEPGKLPPGIANRYKATSGEKGDKITLALMQNYTLLNELDTPVGRVFNEHKEKIKNMLSKRNNSLMAHGIAPISKQDCRESLVILESFISQALNSLDERAPDMQALQFPTDLLQKAGLV